MTEAWSPWPCGPACVYDGLPSGLQDQGQDPACCPHAAVHGSHRPLSQLGYREAPCARTPPHAWPRAGAAALRGGRARGLSFPIREMRGSGPRLLRRTPIPVLIPYPVQEAGSWRKQVGVLVGSTYPEIQGSSPEAHSPEPILKEWRREKNHERRQVGATSVRSRGFLDGTTGEMGGITEGLWAAL